MDKQKKGIVAVMCKTKRANARQSNFELLRIVCMISIVVFHIFTQTDAGKLQLEDGIPYLFFVFLGYGGRLVCNCFVMIGAWFLCDSEFKPERVVNLWMQVFFYAVGITTICTIMKVPEVTLITFVQAFWPIMGRPVWFAAEYLCLLMLSPFLNELVVQAETTCCRLLIIFGVLIIGCATLFPVEHTTPAFSELVWFMFLYLLVAYFKGHPYSWMEKRCVCICGGVSVYLASVTIYILLKELNMGGLASYYLVHYENILSFMVSVFLFYTFKNINIGSNKAINIIGESTFAVYVIHQTPCFYPVLWNGIFAVNEHVGKSDFLRYILFVMIMIFICSIVVENIRKFLFKRLVYTRGTYGHICSKILHFYGKS